MLSTNNLSPLSSRPPIDPSSPPGNTRIWLLGAGAIIVILLVAVMAYLFLHRSQQVSVQPSPTQALLVTDVPTPTDTPLPSPSPSPTPATLTIEIRNGTHVAGLAQSIKDKLTAENFTVSTIGNATNRSVTKTTVYDLTGTNASTAAQLAKDLSARTASVLPKGEATTTANILIIVGTDISKTQPSPSPTATK